jgi:hypothetical protein
VAGIRGRRRNRLLGDVKETREHWKDRNDGKTKQKSRRRNQLLDGLMEVRGCWKLKEEALYTPCRELA